MKNYEGKRAVVTGGTHGVGRAAVDLLLEGGADVLLTGRNKANLEAARSELGSRARVLPSDAGSIAAIDELAGTVRTELGEIDFLFVNAGYAVLAPFAEMTEQTFDDTFAVNAKGAYFTAQRLAPLIREGGSIVFTTSIANGSGVPGMSAYAASKAALRSFAKTVGAELLTQGVRVNAVSPGFIDTPTKGLTDAPEEVRAALSRIGDELTPMQRHGSPEEVARAALFLAFDATFTTGAEFTVDGGRAQQLSPPR